jgi:hypothetical protein
MALERSLKILEFGPKNSRSLKILLMSFNLICQSLKLVLLSLKAGKLPSRLLKFACCI